MSTKIEDKPIAHAGADSSPRCAVSPGSDPNACNRYDLRFVDWFRRHGWQIHQTPAGIDVWTNGDASCPYKVTRGMIARLEWNGHIERIFPRDAAVLDYVWIASDQNVADEPRP